MEVTLNFLYQLIGQKTVENAALQEQLRALEDRIRALEAVIEGERK